jgi:hypothetical protein
VKRPDDDLLTQHDMLDWLRLEVAKIMKEADMRTREATEIVTAYAIGEINAREANSRLDAYNTQWGDALKGISLQPNMTDADVHKAMNKEKKWASRPIKGTSDKEPSR